MFDCLFTELACYEGEETANTGDTGNTSNTTPTGKAFSQEDVNKFLAEDRRKHQERYSKLEKSYEGLLGDQNLVAETRDRLETELESLRATFRTKEQQIEHDKQKQQKEYESKLQTATESAKKYEALYTNFVIDDALRSAAVAEESYDDSQIPSILRPLTSLEEVLDEDGKPTGKIAPMVKFPDVDAETGQPIETRRTPAEAVKRMKELPLRWGNLFRANVVSGVGQGTATGSVTPGKGGSIDPSKLTPEQYRKIRKENPGLLGLRNRS